MFDALIAQAGGLEGPFMAFLQVLMIDLVLAGDNAVAVGLAAGGLPVKDRRKVILYGLGAAVVLRIGFALITTWLLGVIGLLLAGGVLLLWVCWKMWRELREQATHDQADAVASIDDDPTTEPRARPVKSFKQAFIQVLIADVSMSLDNVLAVAGAAREHPGILVFGLLLMSGWRYTGSRPLPLNIGIGTLAGLLKGATGMSGPPVILYLLAGPEAAKQHRANLILFFGKGWDHL